jgi:putative ABC transport system permease protein
VAAQAPGSLLESRAAFRATLDSEIVQNGWTERTIIAVLLLYVAIAAVNTLVMHTLGRRREFAVLRLAGTTRRKDLRMVALELVLVLGLTLLVGLAIAAVTLVPLVKGTTGTAVPYVPAAGWIAVIGGVVVLGALATAVPARMALRTLPVEAIGVRE